MLAAAAFTLGACGGGGGNPGPSLSAANPGVTFPTTGKERIVGYSNDDPTAPAGLTLENFVRPDQSSLNFIQYSEFEFAPPVAARAGNKTIALSKATKAASDYAAIAYHGILEYSAFLFQGGIYPDPGPDADFTSSNLGFSIGYPPEDNRLVAGTYNGIAIAIEYALPSGAHPDPRSLTIPEAERHIVQGDVEIDVAMNGETPAIGMEFSNWRGGTLGRSLANSSYPSGPSIEAQDIQIEDSGFSFGVTERQWSGRGHGQFYGPQAQEVGGSFLFHFRSITTLYGVFGAKKQ